MTNFTKEIRVCVLTLCTVLCFITCKATTFTAVASGNFNAAATWGGAAPTSTISSDIVIIPSGITVTLTSDETFSGTSSLTVNGTLTSSTYVSGLIMTSGILAGNGTITVDSLALGLTSGITYTGSMTAQKATSLGITISTAANITIAKVLHLLSGALSLSSGSVGISSGAMIEIGGGTLSASGSGSLNLNSTYDVSYINGSATAGAELSGSGLRNITVNVPGNISLSANLTENGTLILTAGSLALNSHDLIFGASGDLAASGSGTLSSNSSSSIIINTAAGLTGVLRFANSGNTVNNLTINMSNSSSSVSLGSDVNVNGQLSLQSGKIRLGSNNLTLTAGSTVVGGSANSYVVTDASGTLTRHIAASGSGSFYVGTTTNFAPITITDASGSASGDVGINVIDMVYANGTTGVVLSASQPLVSATWFVTNTATGSLNYTMQAMWSAGMEVNGFNRGQAYISHYTSGAWDLQAYSAATASGSMYALTRTGITSLSPFTVADKDAHMTTGISTVPINNDAFVVYPNPASTTLYFNANADIKHISIYDLMGRMVKSEDVKNNSISIGNLPVGSYNIRLTSTNITFTKQFVKQ